MLAMPTSTIHQACERAIRCCQEGRLDEAEAICRQILAAYPDHAHALHLLGLVEHRTGRRTEALDHLRRSIQLKPDAADYHTNLGAILADGGELEPAINCFRRAVSLGPHLPQAHHNLGNALKATGRIDEAVLAYHSALDLRPDYAEAHNHLGSAFLAAGKLDEAMRSCQDALALRPDYAEAHNNLGCVFQQLGQAPEAIAAFRQAMHHSPQYAEAQNNLASALEQDGQLDEAVAAYRLALALRPTFPEALNNLARVFRQQGDLDQAIQMSRQALSLRPNLSEAWRNLGDAQRDAMQLDDAIATFRQGLAACPDPATASDLLYSLLFHPDWDAAALLAEHRLCDERFGTNFEQHARGHANDPSPQRRLRIGYVSPDFRQHVVGYNMLPVLREHDRDQFEIFCYSNVATTDAFTDRFRKYAAAWRDIRPLGDDRAAELIRADRIDILVDLTLHMARNRLLLFARKPAPVQVTFAGYPGTTGLRSMDYRLTDPYLDPPGRHDDHYGEKSVRLPDSFWCYDPIGEDLPVNDLPALAQHRATFGCLNHFCKLNNQVLRLWGRVLHQTSDSRLVLLCRPGKPRRRTLESFALQGVDANRVEFVDLQPRARYLQTYHRIDIGLDTVPYNGHTTSLDSYWMGVPVITRVGRTVVGRAGWSQLSNLGLTELAANDDEQFVQIASKLAGDLPGLAQLRATLRQRMKLSPLMDVNRFTRGIEAAFRSMWATWCEAPR